MTIDFPTHPASAAHDDRARAPDDDAPVEAPERRRAERADEPAPPTRRRPTEPRPCARRVGRARRRRRRGRRRGRRRRRPSAERRGAGREPSPFDRPGDWYVVHTYAGYENKVKSNLPNRIRSMHVEERIFEVVIPMEDVIEFKGGQRRVVQKKVFPGYLLVRMDLDDDSWYVVRNTPGVTGFVGPSGSKPDAAVAQRGRGHPRRREARGRPGREKKVRPRVEFEEGEQVRVVTGPFADFNGVDLRDRRRPLEAQGAREHLRARDARRARVRPGRQALGTADELSERSIERTRREPSSEAEAEQ